MRFVFKRDPTKRVLHFKSCRVLVELWGCRTIFDDCLQLVTIAEPKHEDEAAARSIGYVDGDVWQARVEHVAAHIAIAEVEGHKYPNALRASARGTPGFERETMRALDVQRVLNSRAKASGMRIPPAAVDELRTVRKVLDEFRGKR